LKEGDGKKTSKKKKKTITGKGDKMPKEPKDNKGTANQKIYTGAGSYKTPKKFETRVQESLREEKRFSEKGKERQKQSHEGTRSMA